MSKQSSHVAARSEGAAPHCGQEPGGTLDLGAAVRARWAITAVFFINGLLLASYIVRIPSLKADLGLTSSQLGFVLTLFGVSALFTMQFVGRLVARFGSVRLIRCTLGLLPLALCGVGLAHDAVRLSLALVVMGTVHGTLDVAMNGHAVVVERLRQRPIMNSCHAAWSVSAVLGSLIGSAVLRAGVTPAGHLLWVGGVLLPVGLAASAWLLPAAADREGGAAAGPKRPEARGRGGWTWRILVLGAMGLALMICEAAVTSWSGVFLHDSRGASFSAAALGYTAFTLCQAVGRLVGDRLTERVGSRRLFRLNGSITVLGLVVVVVGPSQSVSTVGFAVMGIGTSVLVPLIFSAAGHAGGQGPGAAMSVSRVTTFTYAGVLTGPALVGWLAHAFDLSWTFAGIIPVMLAVVLGARTTEATPEAATTKT
ncbi:MFS transporter [Streptomyces sp. CRN 30]|uniref:MFS transporter n=1 Tax=Streptomyces sp. CRN 30 TaxID=3075613 RepID=UPI002A827A77|nr:MFS transporter [Streptomyces sp. CRN 30]